MLDGFAGKRVLEIGPKHGRDSELLAALEPRELVLIDLPEKRPLVQAWLPALEGRATVTFLESDVLSLDRDARERLATFDLVWCLGVLYHNTEQFRLVKRLYDFCADGGRVVLESATTRNRRLARSNVVELHWPRTYREVPTITHLPSRGAIESWLAMAGFSEVERPDVYSRGLGRHRCVFTATRRADSRPYGGYRTIESSSVSARDHSPT
jgi:2-polyprenyl-3-methyl-5-hydroxy-6-metoxy-1,4-benzoquinol methylase